MTAKIVYLSLRPQLLYQPLPICYIVLLKAHFTGVFRQKWNSDTDVISSVCYPNKMVSEMMTKENLITAPVGTTLDQAKDILQKYKIEKLPVVDDHNTTALLLL